MTAVDAQRPAAVPLAAVRVGSVSLRVSRRPLVMTVLLGVAIVAVVGFSCFVGDFPLPAADVLAALTGSGSTATDFVVLDLRLARALCAVAIGAALGASGAAFRP